MQPRQRRSVTVTASTSDPFDGLVRLLLDAARFGFGLDQVSMTMRPDTGWAIGMTIEVQPSLDCAVIAERLSRHPAIMDLRVAEPVQDPCEPPETSAHSSMLANEWMQP